MEGADKEGDHEVIIVGAGPAGLAAALLLGRCRRRVFVCDSGEPRNAVAKGVRGFLTRDGVEPAELRRIAREEALRYPSVEIRDGEAVDVRRGDSGFEVTMADGKRLRSRVLLLATGQVDILPDIPGAKEHYGRGVHHCPYCDGWENRDGRWVAYGKGRQGLEYALELLTWSRDLALCSDGPAELDDSQRKRLSDHGIPLLEEKIMALDGDGKELTQLVFSDGSALPCDAFFFYSRQRQRSHLAEKLGAELDDEGAVICDGHAATGIPGLYVAGNTSCGLQLAMLAAAEGTEAAYAINTALQEADLARREGKGK